MLQYSLTFLHLGDCRLQLGKVKAAHQAFENGRALIEPLASADETNSQCQWYLTKCYTQLGRARIALGDTEAALASHRRSWDIYEKLTSSAGTGNAIIQQDRARRRQDRAYNLADEHLAHRSQRRTFS